MRYVSTRGEAPDLGFADAVLAGLAADGGLYVPATYPSFTRDDFAALRGRPYAEVAHAVIEPFTGGQMGDALGPMIEEAYATFAHPAVAPLVQMGPNHFMLELHHGRTLAFKDVAMQLLARLMDHILGERGRRATIVGATSGDTGGAAIDAFAGRTRTDVFILFPEGRVSDVQRRQMTSGGAGNVHAIAVDGDFDDCQALVKAMFGDARFRDEVALSGVNSINWARIVAQVVYYVTSACALGAPERPVSFTVPTGNFGDVFAGYVAHRMGLPIERLVVATNDNDLLDRTLRTGTYERRPVERTTSPSMDIAVSSNFERLLFDAYERDAGEVRGAMASLAQSGRFEIKPPAMERMRGLFAAGRCDREAAAARIARVLAETDIVVDPHTAIGLEVAERHLGEAPMVTLATAHAAKFPDAVEDAIGRTPHVPPRLAGLMERDERYDALPNDLSAVQSYIRERSRAVAAPA